MRLFRRAFWGTLLLADWAAVAATPVRPVQAEVDVRACKIGRPVTLTLRVSRQAGEQLLWDLADKAVASKGALLLKARTRVIDDALVQHQVMFTATQGGRWQSGPFPVVAKGRAGVDTLYAPAVAVQFQPEPLRPGLHALRPVMPVWKGVAGRYMWTLLATGLVLVGAGAGAWQLLRKRQPLPLAAQPLDSLEQARQAALLRIEALESHAARRAEAGMPEELLSIVREYLKQRAEIKRGGLTTESAAEVCAEASGGQDLLTVGLADLNRARFAPGRLDAASQARLLAVARELVLGESEVELTQTESAAQ
ncbi:cytochrome c-type biogenesis protein CcmH [Hymenobacter sp. 5317J-9]|uniref:cytochrome c-type biogenesis protein CcmH n=1 Tax=Hymenobacter sp. 5317J-9 TaxID=2932250 RepID=UPI001FD6445D|nr:cytochrome c-type biogenesis protein CcmH [Hymenobacter sp. 5317J-9]UOQ96710.1 cytochrome c-type biogenesis protein CcmH [Hymenobacter sp. 5317J-9]